MSLGYIVVVVFFLSCFLVDFVFFLHILVVAIHLLSCRLNLCLLFLLFVAIFVLYCFDVVGCIVFVPVVDHICI